MIVQDEKKQYLNECFSEIGVHLTERQADSFLTFYEMLVEKNKVMNLTAITQFEDVVLKHYMDSLCLTLYKNITKEMSVLDLGTGAGFPGLPLAIIYPETSFILVDSLNKRILFLNEVIHALCLPNVRTIHARAEDLGHEKLFRGHFDLVLSRAVASLPVLCEYALPFVRKGGEFIAYKSGNIDDELSCSARAVHELGAKIEKEPARFTLPGTDLKRTFVFIKKTLDTPGKYPRRAGLPSKQPL